MFDLSKIVDGITKVITRGTNTASLLSAFGNLDASKMQVVQAAIAATQKVHFPDLTEAVKKGDYQKVVSMIMDSKSSMPDFHKAFVEEGGEKALEEVSKKQEVVEAVKEIKDAEPEVVVKVETTKTVSEKVGDKIQEAKENVSEKIEDVKKTTKTVAENVGDKIEEAKDNVSKKIEDIKK